MQDTKKGGSDYYYEKVNEKCIKWIFSLRQGVKHLPYKYTALKIYTASVSPPDFKNI